MAEQRRNPGSAVFGFNDPPPQQTTPAETPLVNPPRTPEPPAPAAPAMTPQYVYVQGPPPSVLAAPAASGGALMKVAVVVLLLLGLINLYLVITARQRVADVAAKQGDQLELLTRRLDSNDERYSQLRAQFQVTSEKLGLTEKEAARARELAAQYQRKQQEAVSQLNSAIQQKASADEVNKLQADTNAKIGGVSNDIAGTKKDLDAAKAEFSGALAGTKGELTGAIARTHDELVALAHKTDRDYFEFNITKKGSQQKVGTVMIQLERTNPKKNQFTVNLYADDKRIERRDQGMNSPVYFYLQGASSALELVVNKLGKDNISGYVSTPKGFFPTTPNVLAARPGA
jgi:predicted  nucleic acid-binding Zn-ribbon protein